MPTQREWLASQGLAIAGARGRFGAAAKEALVKAIADGMVFDAPAGAVAGVPRAPRATGEPVEPVAKPDKGSYDPGKVREWATAQGIETPKRGKLSYELINRYLADNPDTEGRVERPAATDVVEAAPAVYPNSLWQAGTVKVSDSEICDGCNYSISHCYCPAGPTKRVYGTVDSDAAPIALERIK